jgi:urease accessory protein
VVVRPGIGRLDVECVAARSVVSRAFATSPLRLLTPRSHGRAAWVYTASYGGGLLGGDALALSIHVGTHARAFLSTQASTKVYRADRPASVEVVGTVAAAGQLIVWPDPVVCFAGSSYRQRQAFDIEGSAALVLVDWMTSGRRACGERWNFERYDSRVTVRFDGRPVLIDAVSLSAGEGDLAARMGRFDVMCAVTIVGHSLGPQVDGILSSTAGIPFERHANTLVAAAPLSGAGCIVRILGRSVQDVGRVLGDYLSFVTDLLGDDPWLRKW